MELSIILSVCIVILVVVCVTLDRLFVLDRKIEDNAEITETPVYCDCCDKRIPSLSYTVKCHSMFYTDTWFLCDTCFDKVEDTLLNLHPKPH